MIVCICASVSKKMALLVTSPAKCMTGTVQWHLNSNTPLYHNQPVKNEHHMLQVHHQQLSFRQQLGRAHSLTNDMHHL